MPRLPRVSSRDVIRVLTALGFEKYAKQVVTL